MAKVEIYRGYGKGYRTIEVKNLGWLLRHAGESYILEAIRDRYAPGEDGPLEPNLLRVVGTNPTTGYVWTYWTNFASWSVLQEWIQRPRFAHLSNRINEDRYVHWMKGNPAANQGKVL